METAYVVGLGTWLPETVRTNDAWPSSFGRRDHARGDRTFNDIPLSTDPAAAGLVDQELRREADDPFLGAVRRHVADAHTTSLDAETQAAQRAIQAARIDPTDITLVLAFSAVPDRVSPSSAGGIAQRVGAIEARAIGIDAACASGVVQLDMARAFIQSGRVKAALLVHSHLMLRAMPMDHPASPGLGDAASAIVVTSAPIGGALNLAVRATEVRTHGEFAQAVTWVRGQDDASDLAWWRCGGDFRPGSRQPEAVKVLMRDTVAYGARTLRAAAAEARVDPERIDVFASVQPRGFLPRAIAQYAGLREDRAVSTYERIAHVGSCGPVFNLLEAKAEGRIGRGVWLGMYGQGAGFTRAAAILEAV